MTESRLLDLVDTREFRTLFIDELGWSNPDQQPHTFEVDGTDYTLTQVAGYKGMRIWHCTVLPPRPIQRQLDILIGQDSHERLTIFTNDRKQEWRWPRRAQMGSTNAKLVVHEHHVGDRATHLTQRLKAIELDFDEEIPLVTLLDRMRDAFDTEAETASVAAARLMGTLYAELEAAGVGEHEATLLLARLLFLLFGDDTDMWKPQPQDMFERYLRDATTSETLHMDLLALFEILDTDERDRELPSDSVFNQFRFRYVNGGLFRGPLRLPPLPSAFRDSLVDACEFDWSIISPAVFGSMFQTVKSKEARRTGGEHYTTEENIRKAIEPLFLDEYRQRFERAKNDKGQLTKLHNELGRLRFLDPACGCGNFLIVAYRELRALELDLLKRRRELDMVHVATKKVQRAQLTLDVSQDIQVTLDHFYGIEIEEWPARIAETAMLLVDHLANQQMENDFGAAPDRLPIDIAPTIRHADALDTDWRTLLPPTNDTIVMGNPPFIGISLRSEEQTVELQHVWGDRYHGTLDYVTGWYAKAMDYFYGIDGRWAFVSTNSITQGEAVAPLFNSILDEDWKIHFAHRTFRWTTEAAGGASVHCVIIGFSRNPSPPRLFDYPNPAAEAIELLNVRNISPYLTDGPSVVVMPSTKPLNPQLGEVVYGNKPTDDGQLIVEPADYEDVIADPIAAKYVRQYVGARELLHNTARYCLWLVDATLNDLNSSPELRRRVAAVRTFRSRSKALSTRQAASTAHLFRQIAQPDTPYLCIPRHVSESRPYFLSERYPPTVICSDANFLSPDADGFVFSVVSSTMFITWQRTVGGRIKSDLRFNKLLTWNTFPLPPTDRRSRANIIAAGKAVLAARDNHSGESLAAMYTPNAIPPDLLDAHTQLDSQIDALFEMKSPKPTVLERQDVLFERYESLSAKSNLSQR